MMEERGTWIAASVAFLLLIVVTLSVAPKQIQEDIATRAAVILDKHGNAEVPWGTLTISGRDIISLDGVAPDDVAARGALADLRAMWGVRVVRDNTEVAALRIGPSPSAPTSDELVAPPTPRIPTARESAAQAMPLDLDSCQALIDTLLSKRDVHFSPGGGVLHRASVPLLEHLATALVHCPAMLVTITSHADGDATNAQAPQLSLERSRAVAEYLASRGVHPKRLFFTGRSVQRQVVDDAPQRSPSTGGRIEISLRSDSAHSH